MICKYFLPFSRLPFNSVDYLLCCAEAFLFDVVTLIFAFVAFVASNPKNYHQDQRQGAYHLCFLLGVLWFQVYVQIFNPF